MAHGPSLGPRSSVVGGASTTHPGGGAIPAMVTASEIVQNVVPLCGKCAEMRRLLRCHDLIPASVEHTVNDPEEFKKDKAEHSKRVAELATPAEKQDTAQDLTISVLPSQGDSGQLSLRLTCLTSTAPSAILFDLRSVTLYLLFAY